MTSRRTSGVPEAVTVASSPGSKYTPDRSLRLVFGGFARARVGQRGVLSFEDVCDLRLLAAGNLIRLARINLADSDRDPGPVIRWAEYVSHVPFRSRALGLPRDVDHLDHSLPLLRQRLGAIGHARDFRDRRRLQRWRGSSLARGARRSASTFRRCFAPHDGHLRARLAVRVVD